MVDGKQTIYDSERDADKAFTDSFLEGKNVEQYPIIKGFRVYPAIPDGWSTFHCNMEPNGYTCIRNNKSLFGGEYEHGIIKN